MFRRVRLWLTAVLVILFLLLYALTSILIYSLTMQLTMDDVDTVLTDTARPLTAEVLKSFDRGQFPTEFITLAKLASLYPKVSAVILRDAMGNVIANTNPQLPGTIAYKYSMPTDIQSVFNPATHAFFRIYTIDLRNPYGQTEGYLQVALNIQHDLTGLHRLRNVLWAVALAGAVLATIAGFYMSRISLRPVVRSWRRQQQFVADASHELRTPLSIVQLNLELVQGHVEQTIAENAASLDVIEREVARLSRLTQDLLTLAKADSFGHTVTMQNVDLIYVASLAVESFIAKAHSKGLKLKFAPYQAMNDGSYGVVVRGDAERLHQLLAILIDNAIKYTLQGEVEVLIEMQRKHARVIVRDTGIGIDANQVRQVFDRFFRTDDARARGSGGSGLGLAIAKWIVQAHRGKISVRSVLGQGTEFAVVLPVVHEAPGIINTVDYVQNLL